MTTAYINRIATAVPPNDVHQAFVRFAQSLFGADRRSAVLFKRMAEKSGIEHRYSHLLPANDAESASLNAEPFYRNDSFPDTATRMRAFEAVAPDLAQTAIDRLELNGERKDISHLIVTCCTGLSAPGIDFDVIERCGLSSSVERTMVGFMGCYAAMNALKLARHIVRSEPSAKVLVLNLELCTLHLRPTTDLEEVLSFLIFADGCSASLITDDPTGIGLDSFRAVEVPNTRDLIRWNIRNFGFDMVLSGRVPTAIHDGLHAQADAILAGAPKDSIDLWAVHPGGRSVLDAVERALELAPDKLAPSRDILRRYGNMSSATVMFVLDAMLRAKVSGANGCGMSFGPGLVAETMRFHMAG